MQTLRLPVTLTCERTGKTARIIARPPNILGGIWIISERARREACKRMGADWDDPNPKITGTATVRAVDRNGYHTFTIYPKD